MLQLYDTNQKITFDSNVVTTVNCTAQYTLGLQNYNWAYVVNENIPRHTMNSSVATGFNLQDGQTIVLIERDEGFAICAYEGSTNIQIFNFNLLPQSSSTNFGLQTFNTDGSLNYCAVTSKVLTPTGYFSHFGSNNNQLYSSSILDRLIIMPLIVASSYSLFQGQESNPGVSTRQRYTHTLLKRVGNVLSMSSRNTNDWHVFFNGPTSQIGTFGISALMLDSNKL